MASIELLGSFSKLFELFGLQYFSFRHLKKGSIGDRPTKNYTVYFLVLLVPLVSLTAHFVISEVAFQNENARKENYLRFIIVSIMSAGLIVVTLVGLFESYFKTHKLKAILVNATDISSLCVTEFYYLIDYTDFKKVWKRKCISFCLISLTSTLIVNSVAYLRNSPKKLVYIMQKLGGSLSLFFFIMIVFKFTFFVDLVNFQLENLHSILKLQRFSQQKSFVSTGLKRPRALAFRRLYNKIYVMAQLVNEILSLSLLLTLTILVIVIVNTSYQFMIIVLVHSSNKKISGRFCSKYDCFYNQNLCSRRALCYRSFNFPDVGHFLSLPKILSDCKPFNFNLSLVCKCITALHTQISDIKRSISVIETDNADVMRDECKENFKQLQTQLTLQPVCFTIWNFYTICYSVLASVRVKYLKAFSNE